MIGDVEAEVGMHLEGLEPWGGLGSDLERAAAVVVGLPYDGSAVYRRGAAQAPARLRRLSAALPPVAERGTSMAGLRIHDLGDLDLGASVEAGWPVVAEQLAQIPAGRMLTSLGGDHCCAIPVLAVQAKRHPDLAVVWIDAHPDLCDSSRGGRWTCGCALRRGLDVSGLEPAAVTVVGCRDFDPEEITYAKEKGLNLISTADVVADPARVGRAVGERLGRRPIHVSFDIDVLDPAFAPGTEIPSAGGLSTRQALDLLRGLAGAGRLVGLDVVEVCPPADHGDITTLAALKVIFETWALTLIGSEDKPPPR